MGFLSFLTKGLGKTRNNLSMKLDGFSGKLSEDTLEELEEILILSDVSVATAGKICSMLGAKMKKRSIDAKNLRTELRDTIVELLSPDVGLNLSGRPAVIMMVGVNGVGKTTTIGKLAHYLITEGKTVLLGAADTFRAAAGEQLEIWAQRNHCQMIRHAEGADPAAVVFDTIAAGKARNVDVILCDTAGRLHNKKNLMDELSKMNRIILREAPDSSREVLLVLDATTGQNGLSQAKLFAEACGVTGVVLTKLDGTAKGGVVISIREQLGLPIKLVGVGEQLEDLKPFSAYEYATALLFDEGTT
ncbi:MAG: signal recognition particle-docking protein FtsY [Angelakisella sp.]